MSVAPDSFLPSNLPAERVAARIGLISDTHTPDRLAALPPAICTALCGVDLLLHAGDVGEFWVLDRLSVIAPVIAVHGNDETADAQRELPYQQVVVVAGQRILLTHAHYPNRDEEMASRRDDAWKPKLARRAAMGQRAGASIVVFGHSHVPMAYRYDHVLLVNPGAIASGNYTTRQRIQTVALLFIRDDGVPFVTHVNLASPQQPFAPPFDAQRGFRATHALYSESILSPALAADTELFQTVYQLPQQLYRPILRRVAHRCWSGEQEFMTHADLLVDVRTNPDIPDSVRARLEAVLARK